jgi:hypothetical protein
VVNPGCSAGYRVESSVDARGVEIDRMVDNEIGLEGEGEYSDYAMYQTDMYLTGVEQHCDLNAWRQQWPGGQTTYYLHFSYTGPRYLNIQNRRSLKLVIDLYTSTTLEGRGEVTRAEDKMYKTFTESFDYLIPVEYLVTMAGADDVQVIVEGVDFELRGYLTEKNFADFKKFVADYVDWNE